MDHVRANFLFEGMFIVNENSERRDGRPHCERRDGRPHCERRLECLTNIMWALMADLTLTAAMAGLTNVL